MKIFAVISSLLFLSLTANAQSSCLGEAQISAKVAELKTDSMTYCKIMVKDVNYFSASQVCPLDLSEVLSKGIDIELTNDHECNYNSETISGVIVKNQAGKIIID